MEKHEINIIKDQFKAIQPRFVELTNEETFLKECSFALQHFNKNDFLAKSTTESKMEAVMNVAMIGLTLNPVLKLAYLVPRTVKEKGQYVVKCYLEPSYQGLVKLITDTGSAKTVYSHVVYEGDDFEVNLGSETSLTHKPKFKSKKIVLAYAVAILNDGTKQIDVMPIDDIYEIRNGSESYKAWEKNNNIPCIWIKYEGEMAKKTVTKRLTKYLPKTDKWDKLAEAIDLTDQDFQCSYGQIMFIESLLHNANMDDEDKASIERSFDTMTSDEAKKMIEYLKDNQLDPITQSLSPTKTEISQRVGEIAKG